MFIGEAYSGPSMNRVDEKRHGTRYCYTVGGCRCRKCRAANTAYQIKRNRQKKAEAA